MGALRACCGRDFAEGRGIGRDYQLALFWEKRAAKLGSTECKHAIERLTALIDPNRKKKSMTLRLELEGKLKKVCADFSAEKISLDEVDELVCDVESSYENSLYDAVLTKEDAREVWKSIHKAYEILGAKDVS